ncbi:MAG: hypothetical protein OEW19_17600, partial [Acidobacteriota bacterium]|nr:hypothetical protein [Acidobacteriota bacterium]
MALVDSLMTAMVRADGDALVMHVGEKPIVVAGARTIDLSNHGLNLSAMVGMLGHLLPADAQATLGEFGAVEHALPPLGSDRFSVVAARGGDDIWIEIRRRRESLADSLTEEPAVPEDAAHHEREAAPAESGAAAEPAAPGDSDAVAESEVWAESAAPVEEPAAPTESVDAMAPVEEQVEPDADAARVAPLESTSPAEEPASSESVHTAEPVVPVDSVAPAEDPTARVESVAAAAPVAQGETDAVAESDVRAESGAPPEEPAAPAESVDAMAPVGAPVSPVEPDALSGSVTAASVPPAEEPAAPATSAPAVAPVEGLAVPVESDAVAARVAPLESASPAEEPASPESVRTAEPVGPVDGVSPAEDPVAPVESHQGAAARTAPARPDTVVAGDDQTPKAEASGADTVGDAEECEAQAGPLQHADEQPAGPSGVRVAAETPSTAAERPASTESDAPSEAAQPAPVVDAPAAADSESPAAAAVEGDVARTIDIESEEIEAVAAAVVEPQPVPALASAGARQRSEGELTPVMFNESTPASGSSAGEPPSPAAPFRGQSSVQTGDETPMTRTLRIEVPARTNPARASLDALLRVATAHDVSELFLISQSKMYIRAGGEIRPLSDESTLQAADVEALVAELTPEPWREAVHRGDPAEWN